AEAAALPVLELGHDQLREPGVVGPVKAAEELAQPLPLQRLVDEPLESGVLEPGQVSAVAVRVTGPLDRVAAHLHRVEPSGIGGLAAFDLPLVVELKAEVLAKVLERRLRVRRVAEEHQAVADLLEELRFTVAIAPLAEDRVDLLQLAGLLV